MKTKEFRGLNGGKSASVCIYTFNFNVNKENNFSAISKDDFINVNILHSLIGFIAYQRTPLKVHFNI